VVTAENIAVREAFLTALRHADAWRINWKSDSFSGEAVFLQCSVGIGGGTAAQPTGSTFAIGGVGIFTLYTMRIAPHTEDIAITVGKV
jgi:hypothetical protein